MTRRKDAVHLPWSKARRYAIQDKRFFTKEIAVRQGSAVCHARVLLLAVLIWLAAVPRAMADEITVFAASSLKTALDIVARDYQGQTGRPVVLSYAGSSALARQIELGAPADVVILANTAWAAHLAGAGVLAEGSRRDVLSNHLVLIAPGSGPEASGPVTADMLQADGRLAMALVDAVPAGLYGQAALRALGVWEQTLPRIAQADNVRAALALVALGAAAQGIVYASDALAEPSVHVVGVFAPETHPPIVYPAAAIAGADTAQAIAFLDFLSGAAAQRVFAAHGFLPPDGGVQ